MLRGSYPSYLETWQPLARYPWPADRWARRRHLVVGAGPERSPPGPRDRESSTSSMTDSEGNLTKTYEIKRIFGYLCYKMKKLKRSLLCYYWKFTLKVDTVKRVRISLLLTDS